MGPAATVDLMQRVIARTRALVDQDHLHLLVESNPQIPSRIAHLIDGTGTDPTPELVRIARNLERAGADVLAMPCNTAHWYLPAMRDSVRVPFLDMVELTVVRIHGVTDAHRVGLLASTAVHQTALYSRALAARGTSVVLPADQDELMAIIAAVKRGEELASLRRRLAIVVQQVTACADLIVIACTELSLIAPNSTTGAAYIDSADVLADSIVAFAASGR
jgi:aspartate racemase